MLACTGAAASACWHEAAARHGVPVDLLVAVARTESGLDPAAVHRNRDRAGSYDIGLMQINSGHLRALAAYGIAEQDLHEPCTNLHVGAWLMADLLRRQGYGWNAIGAYNAACTRLQGSGCTAARSRYAWRVYRNLPRHERQTPAP